METPLQVPLEPLGFGLGQPSTSLYTDSHVPPPCQTHSPLSTETEPLHPSQQQRADSPSSARQEVPPSADEEEEEECLVDSQPICFSENPFLVANRKGKGRPSAERILSGPPVGYGKPGQLQPWLFNKARGLCVGLKQHGVMSQRAGRRITLLHPPPSSHPTT